MSGAGRLPSVKMGTDINLQKVLGSCVNTYDGPSTVSVTNSVTKRVTDRVGQQALLAPFIQGVGETLKTLEKALNIKTDKYSWKLTFCATTWIKLMPNPNASCTKTHHQIFGDNESNAKL